MTRKQFLPLALSFALTACGNESSRTSTSDADGAAVYTTFYPTTYFAERISDGAVPVVCPLPNDADPIYWQPPREALAAYQKAGLIVLNGAGFEKWVETASLPATKIVESCQLPDSELIRYKNAVVHNHGPGGEHSHEGIDGHTWLDPKIAIEQTNNILAAMAKRWPDHASTLKANAIALTADLTVLHERLAALETAPMLASHPAYNYLARRYRWDIDSLDLDPAEMPTEVELLEIQVRLQKRPAKILLWESEPLPEIAAKLESEFGLLSIVFSPCETAPESGDYLSAMNANIDRLANAGNP